MVVPAISSSTGGKPSPDSFSTVSPSWTTRLSSSVVISSGQRKLLNDPGSQQPAVTKAGLISGLAMRAQIDHSPAVDPRGVLQFGRTDR